MAQLGWRDVSVVRKPWAGLTPALLTAAPQAGAFAGTRDLLRRELLGVSASVSWLDSKQSALLAIVAANLAYWLIRAPSDVVKQRRQTGRATSRGAVAYVRDGLSAYPVSVLTDLPAILCRTSLYSYWKSSLSSGAAPLAQTEAATVAIAIAVAAITTPLDVLRTTTLQGQLNDTRGKARPVAAIASRYAHRAGASRATVPASSLPEWCCAYCGTASMSAQLRRSHHWGFIWRATVTSCAYCLMRLRAPQLRASRSAE